MSEQGAVVHLAYDWTIVTYFFFGGMSAGTYIFSVAANYWKKEFKPLAKTAAILALIALAIGMFFLLVDLGKPFRMWRLFVSFNPRSAISWGTWFLSIFFLLSLVYTRLLTRGEDELAKARSALAKSEIAISQGLLDSAEAYNSNSISLEVLNRTEKDFRDAVISTANELKTLSDDLAESETNHRSAESAARGYAGALSDEALAILELIEKETTYQDQLQKQLKKL